MGRPGTRDSNVPEYNRNPLKKGENIKGGRTSALETIDPAERRGHHLFKTIMTDAKAVAPGTMLRQRENLV
jgi:hypothetical protein